VQPAGQLPPGDGTTPRFCAGGKKPALPGGIGGILCGWAGVDPLTPETKAKR